MLLWLQNRQNNVGKEAELISISIDLLNRKKRRERREQCNEKEKNTNHIRRGWDTTSYHSCQEDLCRACRKSKEHLKSKTIQNQIYILPLASQSQGLKRSHYILGRRTMGQICRLKLIVNFVIPSPSQTWWMLAAAGLSPLLPEIQP